jgi:hypothetical protein
VAFAEGRHREKSAYGIARHVVVRSAVWIDR